MDDNLEESFVKSNLSDGVMTIEFFHPKSNSMPGTLLTVLAQHIRRAKNPETKVIVLKSAGAGAFCAGASFDELQAVSNEEEAFNFFMGFANVINEMRKSDKLIIARIHGKAVGGGVGIASAADYTIASEKAQVKLSELAIGIGPFTISPAVQRKIGTSAFTQLSVNATQWHSSDWAREKGLFAEVYPDTERLDAAVDRLSSTLSGNSNDAMTEMKKVFWAGCENWDQILTERARISARLVLTEHARNSIQKIREKLEKQK